MGDSLEVNIDQLNTVYSDGLPQYRTAAETFEEGALTLSRGTTFFLDSNIEDYLPNCLEISDYFYTTIGTAALIESGYETFSKEIAFLIYNLSLTNETINLSNYPDLEAQLNEIGQLSPEKLKNFEIDNLNSYRENESTLNQFVEQIASYRGQSQEDILKALDISEEDMKAFLKSMGLENVNPKDVNLLVFLPAAVFASSVILGSGVASSGTNFFSDEYWGSQNEAWKYGTLFGKMFEKMTKNGAAGGVLSALTIGTIIAFQDGEFDLETFLEEGGAASVGAGAQAAVGALLAGMTGAAIIGAATGILVTTGASIIIHSVYYMPGDVPYDSDTWDEDQQRNYTKKKIGVDLETIEAAKKLLEKGEVTREEYMDMLKSGTDDDYIYDGKHTSNSKLYALNYYLQHKQEIDNSADKRAYVASIIGGKGEDHPEEVEELILHYSEILGGDKNE